jgi:DNA-directed RNA polymerase subunit RPC12/RpoP
MSNQEHPRVPLRPILTPWAQHIISAPPVLIASTNTVDYVCGDCGAVLMHAEQGQVHNLVIHCVVCGSYNATDA